MLNQAAPTVEPGLGLGLSRAWRARLLIAAALYFTFLGGSLLSDLRMPLRVLHHALVTLLLAGWLFALIRARRPFPATRLDLPLLIYLLALTFATAFAIDPRFSLEAWWHALVNVLLFYLVIDLMRGIGPRSVFEPLFFTASVVIIMGFAELTAWYFGYPVGPLFAQGWWQIGGLAQPIPPQLHRLTIPLSVATHLSAYLAMLLPVGIAWRAASNRTQTKQGLLLWLIGAAVIQMFSFSRGGLLALSVSLPALGVLMLLGSGQGLGRLQKLVRDIRFWAGVLLITLIVGGLGAVWLNRNLSGHRSGDAQRLDLWRSAWEIGLADPLTGAGPAGYGRALRQVRDAEVVPDHLNTPHNYLLWLWADAGLPGVLALLLIVGAAVAAAWTRWSTAEGPDRLRVAGVIAGLLGFCVQNLVDNFAAIPLMLPCSILAAYLLYPLPARGPGIVHQRIAAPAAAGLIVLGGLGWARSDAAQAYFVRGINRLNSPSPDYQAALADVERAQQLDPWMGLYPAQRAQILGEMAVAGRADPPATLNAYSDALAIERTSDVMLANYAQLLLLAREASQAQLVLQEAAAINPNQPLYRLWLGYLAEQQGQHSRAQGHYEAALELEPGWITSPYWGASALRQAALMAFLEHNGVQDQPRDALAQAPFECWPLLTSENPSDAYCAAQRALMQADYEAAEALAAQLIQAQPELGAAYTLHAAALLELSQPAEAERQARTAVFLREVQGFYFMGRIYQFSGSHEAAQQAFEAAAPVEVQLQGWNVSVYGRTANLILLDVLPHPGYTAAELAVLYALEDSLQAQSKQAEAAAISQRIEVAVRLEASITE